MPIKYSECEENINNKAVVCPNCGYPTNEENERQKENNEIEQEYSRYNIISYLCSRKI